MSSYISILSEFAQNPRVAHAEGVLVHPTHRVCVIAAPVRPIGLCIDYMYNAQLNNCYSSVCMHEKTVCAAAWLFCLHWLALLSSPAGSSVFTGWLFCLHRLALLSSPAGSSVFTGWVFCLHRLGLLSSPACRLFIYFLHWLACLFCLHKFELVLRLHWLVLSLLPILKSLGQLICVHQVNWFYTFTGWPSYLHWLLICAHQLALPTGMLTLLKDT